MSVQGIKFISKLTATGEGLAGLAYVRGLLRAGVPVHWMQLVEPAANAAVPAPSLFDRLADEADRREVRALLDATSRPLADYGVLAMSEPEHWPGLFEDGHLNIGMTGLDTDRPAPHWMPGLDQAHVVCAPSALSCQSLVDAGVRASVRLVPRIVSPETAPIATAQLTAFRETLGIAASHRVLYTVGDWTPRKNLPALLRAYAAAFDAGEAVTLVIKTGAHGFGEAPYYQARSTAELAAAAIERIEHEIRSETGRALPAICLLPYPLLDQGMQLLRQLADGYVSLSQGEAWHSAAFEAACLGTPVIATAWGGHAEYLRADAGSGSADGADWLGAVDCELEAVPIHPPHRPAYWAPQRWAAPDRSVAAQRLRSLVQQPEAWRAQAQQIRRSIAQRYAEPVVIASLLAAIETAN